MSTPLFHEEGEGVEWLAQKARAWAGNGGRTGGTPEQPEANVTEIRDGAWGVEDGALRWVLAAVVTVVLVAAAWVGVLVRLGRLVEGCG